MNNEILYIISFALQLILTLLFLAGFMKTVPAALKDRSLPSISLCSSWAANAVFLGVLTVLAVVNVVNREWILSHTAEIQVVRIITSLWAVVSLALVVHSRRSSPKLVEYFNLMSTSDQELDKRLEDEEKKGQMLEELLENQKHFIYAMAHDLRAPLRAIDGFVELIQETPNEPPNPEYLEHIARGKEKLLLLINALSDYSKIDKGDDKALETVNLKGLVDDVLEDYRGKIEREGIEVQVEALPVVKGVAGKLYHVLQNLIDNALKFGEGRVSVTASRKDGQVVVAITDNGIGIEAEHLTKIFEPFQRLNREEDYQGVGMGLAICKKIITRHGGKIWVESAPGQGTTFYFSLPDETKN